MKPSQKKITRKSTSARPLPAEAQRFSDDLGTLSAELQKEMSSRRPRKARLAHLSSRIKRIAAKLAIVTHPRYRADLFPSNDSLALSQALRTMLGGVTDAGNQRIEQNEI